MNMSATRGDGLLVFWDAAECDRVPFSAAMQAAGLDAYAPDEPDRSVTLRAAVRDAVQQFGMKSHGNPVEAKNLAKGVVGFEAIRVVRGASENDYTKMFSVIADDQDDVRLIVNDGVHGFPNTPDAEWYMTERFRYYLNRIPGTTAGALVRSAIVYGLNGVALSRGGKCFYVPGEHVARYEALAGLINRCNPDESGLRLKWFRYPLEPVGFEQIVNALRAEVAEYTNECQEDLMECTNDGRRMRSDARANRSTGLDQRHEKVKAYERILGVALDDVRATIEHTQGLLAMNALLEVSV